MKLLEYHGDLIDGEYYACYEFDLNKHNRQLYIGKCFDLSLYGSLIYDQDNMDYTVACWNVYEDFECFSNHQCVFHLNEFETMMHIGIETL